MTQEEKELLIKDLSGRIPYRHNFWLQVREFDEDTPSNRRMITKYIDDIDNGWVVECKPYLRPMSSMTEEEAVEYANCGDIITSSPQNNYLIPNPNCVNWLNKKMFDYRGLIGEGLAIEVTEENNPYKD